MAEKELTADKMDKLDRLLAILASFAEVDQVMDLPMMRVLALVCRHDGADKKELMTHLHGYAPGSVTRLINDLGTAGERYGRAKLELVEMGPDRKTHLTPKGVELRDRLFALL